MKRSGRPAFSAIEGRVLLSVLTVDLNASAEKLRTGKRVRHEVLIH
jgi:hypothetical protein